MLAFLELMWFIEENLLSPLRVQCEAKLHVDAKLSRIVGCLLGIPVVLRSRQIALRQSKNLTKPEYM